MPEGAPEARLREEFSRWAEAGRSDEMEGHHLPTTFSISSRRGVIGPLGFRTRA